MTDPFDPTDDPDLDQALGQLLRRKAERAAAVAPSLDLVLAKATTRETELQRRLVTVGVLGILVFGATIAGLGLIGWLGSRAPVGRSPSPSPSASGVAALRRPLLLPSMAPDGTCPVTPVGLTLDGLGPFQGSGPVRVNDLDDVPINELPLHNGWYGQKVFWAVDAREPGPILVRVVRIDAPGEVGLGDALAPELMLSNDTIGVYPAIGPEPPFPLKRIFVDGVSFREPGCYLMQMDGPSTSSTVVFRALATRVTASVSAAAADATAIANASSTSAVVVVSTTLSTYGAQAAGSVATPDTLVWAVRLSGSFPPFSCGGYTSTPHPCPPPATSALILVDARTGAFIEGMMPAPGPTGSGPVATPAQ